MGPVSFSNGESVFKGSDPISTSVNFARRGSSQWEQDFVKLSFLTGKWILLDLILCALKIVGNCLDQFCFDVYFAVLSYGFERR